MNCWNIHPIVGTSTLLLEHPPYCWNIHPIVRTSTLLFEHPPYSPDLAPSDLCLFPELKLFFAGQRFSLNQAVAGYVADVMKNHYMDGIMVLEHCWNKYISLKGHYVEK